MAPGGKGGANLGADSGASKPNLICSSEDVPVLGPVLLFARCVLPSPHAQPDRVDSADTREVNVTKEHGAQLRVLYLVMGKGEASKSLCSGKFSPHTPPKRGLSARFFAFSRRNQADLRPSWFLE